MSRWHWSVYFAFWVGVLGAGGALVGALAFPIVGAFLDGHRWTSDALAGMHHLSFLALIWAPGVALVLSVRRAYRRRHPQTK